jgi:hypothetical protein
MAGVKWSALELSISRAFWFNLWLGKGKEAIRTSGSNRGKKNSHISVKGVCLGNK